MRDLIPGSAITGSASFNGYTRAPFTTPSLVEGDNQATVQLAWLPGTTVLRALDEADKPVDATVRFTGPSAVDALALGGDGEHVMVLPAGGWQFLAEAAGLSPDSRTTTVSTTPGRTIVEFRLRKPRVEVRQNEIVILDPVYFEFDKADIRPDSFAILDQVAGVLLTHPDILRIEVQGHTDSVGDDPYNLDLSQRRVESVERYLIDKGVAEARMAPIGFGESKPIDTNDTDAGRAANRRVEFKIVERATQK